jgi:hypothetical protein
MQAGRNFITAQSYGSVSQGLNVRPQKVFNVNAQSFTTKMGGSHDIKFGMGYRTTDAVAGTLWPGNGILANERANNLQAGVPRGPRRQPRQLPELLRRRHHRMNRVTFDLGVRFDRQDGEALPEYVADRRSRRWCRASCLPATRRRSRGHLRRARA